jgi:hypothetical protein
MTEQQLKRCKEFLDHHNVNYNDDIILLTNGGNSCIMNPNCEWKDFLGYSINSVAQAVADELNKKVMWDDEEEE